MHDTSNNCDVSQSESLTLRQQIAELQQERARDHQELSTLRAERDYFRMIADSAFDWDYWRAPDGSYRYVSPACECITGYRPDEFQADPGLMEQIIHPDDREHVLRHLDDNEQHQQSSELEFRIITRSGEVRWIGHACQPVYDRDGTWLGQCASNRDITTQKQAELDHAHALALARATVESATGGVLVTTPEGSIISFNRRFVDLFQLPSGWQHIDDVHERLTLMLDQVRDSDGFTRRIAEIFRSPEQDSYDVIPMRDGRMFSRHSTPFRLHEQVLGRLWSYRDITEHKQMEEALRESEERYRLLFESSLDGIVITNNAGQYQAANPAAYALLGYRQAELLAMAVSDLLVPNGSASAQRQYEDYISSGSQHGEFAFQRPDGEVRIVEFSAKQSGADIHMSILRDITERKQAEEALRASQRFVQQITTTIPDVLYIYDLSLQRNIYSNRQMTDILGYTSEEVQAMGSDVMPMLVHPDDLPHTLEHLNDMVTRQESDNSVSTVEYRMRHRDGNWRWLLSREVPFHRTQEGRVMQLLGVAHDITERKQAEEALRASQQFIQQIADVTPALIYVFDLVRGYNTFANAYTLTFFGCTMEELQQQGQELIFARLHPDDLTRLAAFPIQWNDATDEQAFHREYCMQNATGDWRYLDSDEVVFQRDEHGTPTHILGVAIDITERKQAEIQLHQVNVLLQEQAIRDPLTGLHNRRYLDETLPRELQRAERQGQPVGVIMLDIDHFKTFNDTYGHDAGDTLLRAVGELLQRSTRGEDITCRYGGEEFTLVLPGASLADTQQRAEELRAGIQTLAVQHNGQALAQVTVSLGIAIFPEHSVLADDIIRAADQSLYQAKRNGRNRVEVVTISHSER